MLQINSTVLIDHRILSEYPIHKTKYIHTLILLKFISRYDCRVFLKLRRTEFTYLYTVHSRILQNNVPLKHHYLGFSSKYYHFVCMYIDTRGKCLLEDGRGIRSEVER